MAVVVIFGKGGHGADIAETFPRTDLVWLDDDPAKCSTWVTPDYPDLVAINDPRQRRSVAERFPDDISGVWVHPRATRGPGVILGRHTHIGANAFLTRCRVGSFVTIGPGAIICGDVTIGDDVLIGAGAVIKNCLAIGDGATIGCGAVVVADVEPGQTVVGNPARPL